MKKLIYVVFILFLVSCAQIEKPKKPENLIPKDQMVNILLDMSILNSAKGVNKKILERKNIDLQEYIYKKYSIDSLQFASSNYYYTYQIEDYKAIYTQVQDSLNKLKEKYTALEKTEEKQKKKRDSLKRADLKLSGKEIYKAQLVPEASTKKLKEVKKKM